MKRVALVFLAVFFLCTTAIAGDGPRVGGELKNLTLNDPLPADQAAYLGVSGKGPFRLSDIKGKTLLIEVYTLYCPFCQAEADRVNEFVRDAQGLASGEERQGHRHRRGQLGV